MVSYHWSPKTQVRAKREMTLKEKKQPSYERERKKTDNQTQTDKQAYKLEKITVKNKQTMNRKKTEEKKNTQEERKENT